MLGCGAALIWKVRSLLAGDALSLFWVAFFIYLIVQGLDVALTQEGHEKDKRRSVKVNGIYRDKFGRFAPIMPYLHLVILLVDYILARLFPVTTALRVVVAGLLLAALAYGIWLGIWLRRQMRETDDA